MLRNSWGASVTYGQKAREEPSGSSLVAGRGGAEVCTIYFFAVTTGRVVICPAFA
jgi:hypothetical protein